ncbi:uncharacterized protein [Epargyreus clarus]|uniref:uncharacterized protein isoform X2 n=1 Tax=Epargyreus clarus TaxID=520877 RepID=UPI003C2FF0FD
MAASGDIEIAQDGGLSNIRLHPYFVALIRWCVSSVWSTATLVLHRLMTTPLPPSTAPKPPKPRPASTDHLHPEPRVDCVVLHTPPTPTIDVIFVHGLYGSLANTWRQGEWRTKYNTKPIKVPLRRSDSLPKCCYEDTNGQTECDKHIDNNGHGNVDNTNNGLKDAQGNYDNIFKSNESSFKSDERKFYDDIRKILPKDNAFITEKFYNNTLLDQVEIVGNYETQANFVKDLFQRDKCENDNDCQCDVGVKCVGCGCVCDGCYSPCWPRDWVKEDYPGARVISINYTSDPYLWRPLWIKESKRLRLHERAEQMIAQLLDLGVGKRPIIWVGHSKGGLFIKQIYCEAYEAYQKLNKNPNNNENNEKRDQYNHNESNNDNRINHNIENVTDNSTYLNNIDNININTDNEDNDIEKECVYIECSIKEAFDFTDSDIDSNLNLNLDFKRKLFHYNDGETEDVGFSVDEADDAFIENEDEVNGNKCSESVNEIEEPSSNNTDQTTLQSRASLWSNSAGFMFYSVPHRGSPLADIKTPITARSVELMEICKDCNLVLSLQDRWMAATATSQPVVRSLVETCRTLMSVLWLRIVSVDSADPGIGGLCGVNVDHREICKPSSRSCLLYQELMRLMHGALNKFNVKT